MNIPSVRLTWLRDVNSRGIDPQPYGGDYGSYSWWFMICGIHYFLIMFWFIFICFLFLTLACTTIKYTDIYIYMYDTHVIWLVILYIQIVYSYELYFYMYIIHCIMLFLIICVYVLNYSQRYNHIILHFTNSKTYSQTSTDYTMNTCFTILLLVIFTINNHW